MSCLEGAMWSGLFFTFSGCAFWSCLSPPPFSWFSIRDPVSSAGG